jgi:hypothetical protein
METMMKRLISAASVALAVAVTVLVIIEREPEPKKTTATHGPWEDASTIVTIVKPEYYSADGRKIAKPANRQDGTSLEGRIDPFLCVRAWDLIPVLAGQANVHPARIATCGLIENKDAVNAWEVAISGSGG